MTDLPPLLHKYRAVDCVNLARLRSMIITKQLWLSRPADFNDPFDCAPVVRTTWDKTASKATALRVAERRTRGAPRFSRTRERKRLVRAASHAQLVTPEEAQAVARRSLDEIRDGMGVLSLTDQPDNILMWSHYADRHRGVMLTFRTNQIDLLSDAMEVSYDEARPVVDLVGDRENTMTKTLLRKAKYWEYEHEWRVVRAAKNGGAGLHAFAAESLAAVTFGAFTSLDVEQAIRQAVGISGCPTRFGRAVLNSDFFRMDIVDA